MATVDAISAPELVYPEAVYLHEGDTYFVRELDLERGNISHVARKLGVSRNFLYRKMQRLSIEWPIK